MKIRLLSGSLYVVILAAFFCLKIFLPNGYGDLCFDGMIYAFALFGTFEMLRATKEKTTAIERGLVFAFTVLVVPFCVLAEYFGTVSGFIVVFLGLFVLSVGLLSLLVLRNEETSLEGLGISLLSAVYPTVLLCLLVIVNHTAADPELVHLALDSRIMILLIFVVSPCADSIAYVFGISFKKYFPKKLAPTLSPNKTVIGGIGGLVGGMLGAAALYFIYNAIVVGGYPQMYIWLPVYLVIGLFAAVATAFGDLVESCIKRKLGVKDMGKIMPGHGGALDRLDGTLFATIVVYAAFTFLSILV